MHSVPSHSASKPHDSDYTRIRARSIRFLILLAAVLALAFFLSLRAGSYNTPAAELIRGIFGRATDNKINLVIRNNRLPRICTAMVSGAGLGLAGCILQSVLRNPLASASTLGVSQGATFGAAVAIIGLGLTHTGSWAIPLCSFLGSLLVAAVILGLSRFKQVSSEGIVLAGVAISSMLTGATTLLQYFADEVALSSLVFWTFGDLGSTSWQSLRGMALAVLLLIVYCYLHRWDYNALLSGGERQKVMLARALAQEPSLLLLDEPTSSLDIRNQYQVLQITRDLCREQDLTAMIVIHDLNLALRFCDRFLLLREGEVYRYGGAEIFDADALRDVYGVKGSIVQVQSQSLVLIEDEEKEKLS